MGDSEIMEILNWLRYLFDHNRSLLFWKFAFF